MKHLFLFLALTFLFQSCKIEKEASEFDFTTTFEKSAGRQTATYDEVITFYENLAEAYPSVKMRNSSRTDIGERLRMVTINPSPETNFDNIKEDKVIILINNGIHPGESDGIDATMMLFRDIAKGTIDMPKNTVIATIPVYNIGGALNRNSGSRTNQNGPEEYGFRGNARNYDLNRDFIKSDTRNASGFARIFHLLEPDIFIDNHVSNGADYQYTLTHLFTQHNKLGGNLGTYLHTELMPSLENDLASKNWDITPYVNVFNRTPEAGFSQFMDSPRYSTGYTALWNTLGMMVETHMLKPYKQRVEGTYELMRSMINIAERDHEKIKTLRKNANTYWSEKETYPIGWQLDTTKTSTLNFKGFEGNMVTSEVTGQPRLEYDRNKPFTKETPYQNYFKATKQIAVPEAYLIPRQWRRIIDRLEVNEIEMDYIEEDIDLEVEVYHIANFETYNRPYEGHYPHYNTTITTSTDTVSIKKDTYIEVKTDQKGIRYLLETLEPVAVDSFFNWNFFDTILQQKEGFSPYVWEDAAAKLLAENPKLKAEFEKKKQDDDQFAASWYQQLDWLHKQSNNYEEAHLRYPIYRVLKK
ncbi:M14 family metallopeptidase [Spongiivirga sp. MCCC 1A20706]|uniref:M14 family metallopeptidase n=1 Tax=Spongiivirga sp. MCCC 1A20706 TaxID=3160963 RepID=UPI00397783B9